MLWAKPFEGLGASIDLIKRMCRDDLETLDLIDRATVNPVEAPIGNKNASNSETNSSNITNCFVEEDLAERGTTREYALRKLRKDRPDLHKEVLAGAKSPHAAMVEASNKKALTTNKGL